MQGTATPSRPPVSLMRHNQLLDFVALRDEAADAVEQSPKTQVQVAEDLDVTKGAISRAIKEAGPNFANLQRRIVDLLTPYRVERDVIFRAVRKDRDS